MSTEKAAASMSVQFMEVYQKALDRVRPDAYKLIRPLGSGGQGSVYLAEQVNLGRKCAIKVIRSDISADNRDEALTRFEHEARIAASIHSQFCASVYDFGFISSEGDSYLVMEYVEGVPLFDLVGLTIQDWSLQERVRIFIQLAKALVALHKAGLVHRDLKPENIIVNRTTGELKLIDFGLGISEGESRMTMTGFSVGTPHYMAPEQAVGDRDNVGSHTDVYAAGCVMYVCLTAEVVYDTKDPTELFRLQMKQGPKKPSDRCGFAIPRDLDRLILHCLENQIAERPSSARELQDRLEVIERSLIPEMVLVSREARDDRVVLGQPAIAISSTALQSMSRDERRPGAAAESLVFEHGAIAPAAGHIVERADPPPPKEVDYSGTEGAREISQSLVMRVEQAPSKPVAGGHGPDTLQYMAEARHLGAKRRGRIKWAIVGVATVLVLILAVVVMNWSSSPEESAPESDPVATPVPEQESQPKPQLKEEPIDLEVEPETREAVAAAQRQPRRKAELNAIPVAGPAQRRLRAPVRQASDHSNTQRRRPPELTFNAPVAKVKRPKAKRPPKEVKPKPKTAEEYKQLGKNAASPQQACKYFKRYAKLRPSVKGLYKGRCAQYSSWWEKE